MTTEESRHSGWLAALDRWLGAAFLRGPMAVGAGWSGRRARLYCRDSNVRGTRIGR